MSDPWLWIVLVAQFVAVFSLVLSSKLLRDDRWVLAMCMSWVISLSQFTFIYVVANTPTEPLLTLCFSAMGGSMGCGISHLFYTRYVFKGRYV